MNKARLHEPLVSAGLISPNVSSLAAAQRRLVIYNQLSSLFLIIICDLAVMNRHGPEVQAF